VPLENLGETLPELSTQWIFLDWNRLDPAKRHMAVQLVRLLRSLLPPQSGEVQVEHGGLAITAPNQTALAPPSPPRSWKQQELDAAIAAYRDDPANEFVELCDLVQKGSETAYRKAKALFGRNAIVRNLGVRGAAMVSKSPVWQALAADLGLPRGKAKPLPLRQFAVVPMDAALAAKADVDDGNVLNRLVIAETLGEIDALVCQAKLRFSRAEDAEQFTALIDAAKTWLDTGKIAAAAALELIQKVIEQARDGRLRSIRPRP
jgi:hypothetical protein